MTVIAFFEDLGVAVSDVLISVEAIGGGILLPSVGDPNIINPPLPIRPTRLVRKFFRVKRPGSEGVFLICGTVSHIDKLTETIAQIISDSVTVPHTLAGRLNRNSVASLVDVAATLVEQSGNRDFELLGMVDGQRYARHFDTSSLAQRLPYWGDVVAFGSGAPYLIDWLREKGNKFLEAGLDSDAVRERAIRAFQGVPALLLEEDTREMRTLRNGVGGYYESYGLNDNSFILDENVLTVFGRFKRGRSSPIFELRRIFFHIYDNDRLVVGSLMGLPRDISAFQPLTVPLDDLHVFEIPPLHEQKSDPKWNPSRLAQLLNSASKLRLTTYRGPEDQSVKRFYHGEQGCRLISAKVSGSSLKIELKPSDLKYFYERTDPSVGL